MSSREPAGMKRVLSGYSLPDATHFKNLLELAGVECVMKNRDLGGGIGDLPVFDCTPEIWVDGRLAERAEAVIRESMRPVVGAAPWRCERCGEDNEPQFAACFNCSGAKPGDAP